MSASIISLLVLGYYLLLVGISRWAGRKSSVRSFWLGSGGASWLVISLGMVGVSLSGVSFVSVPGWVRSSGFNYMQMVLGYVVGYVVISFVLLPVYYRLRVPSIYSYLGDRFGNTTRRAGSLVFIISRMALASLRVYLVAMVLHPLTLGAWGIPLWVTVLVMVFMIWFYTQRAGMQAIIWTDLFQTFVMLLVVVLMCGILSRQMGWHLGEAIQSIAHSDYSRMFEWHDWRGGKHFVKQFLSGAFIPIVMTGLDQNMMQKNLACRTLHEAQKNMLLNGLCYIPVNFLLLGLGALLLLFAQHKGLTLPAQSDAILPYMATQVPSVPGVVSLLFVIGIIAAAFSSADSALTALTTSFCFDLLNMPLSNEKHVTRLRQWVHVGISITMVFIILLYVRYASGTVIHLLFQLVSYVYGPLLGLYSFGLFTRWGIRERMVPVAIVGAPLFCGLLQYVSSHFWSYTLGYELLILNGMITFLLLYIARTSPMPAPTAKAHEKQERV